MMHLTLREWLLVSSHISLARRRTRRLTSGNLNSRAVPSDHGTWVKNDREGDRTR